MIAPDIAALLLIDQPDGFKAYIGAYPPVFAAKFGGCILRFAADAPPPATCP